METTFNLEPSYVRVVIDGIQGTSETCPLYVKYDDIANVKTVDKQVAIYEQFTPEPVELMEENPGVCDEDRHVVNPEQCFRDTTMRINGSRLLVCKDETLIPLQKWITMMKPYAEVYTKDNVGRYITVYIKKPELAMAVHDAIVPYDNRKVVMLAYSSEPIVKEAIPTHQITLHGSMGEIVGVDIVSLVEMNESPETIAVKYKRVSHGLKKYYTGYVLKKELDDLFDEGKYTQHDVNESSIDVYKYKNASNKIDTFVIRDLDIDSEYCLKDIIEFSELIKDENK